MQNIFIYPGSSLEIIDLLTTLNPSRIFLITGKNSFKECGANTFFKNHLSKYKFTHFSDFKPNPNFEDLQSALISFHQTKHDIIIAVGGGSVIDMGKLVNYFHNAHDKNLYNYFESNPDFLPLPFICLPTTAGSGSEATHFAVLYWKNKKYSIANKQLKPSYVIIDPVYQYSQSTYQKAISGIDALSQAIESMWSIHSTYESIVYSQYALELILQNIENAVINNDKESHLKIAIGSYYAGKAINIAKTTAAHALSYVLTSQFDIPHGHAVGLSLGEWFTFNSMTTIDNSNDSRGPEHLKNILNSINRIFGSSCSEQTSNKIKSLLIKLGLKTKLSDFNINEKMLKTIAKAINYDRLNNNPRKVSYEDIELLLLNML